MQFIRTISYIIILAWSLGFFYFLHKIENYTLDRSTITDAIVVFGNSKQKLHTASALHKYGYAPFIFITGESDINAYKNFLIENKIPSENLIIDMELVNNKKNFALDTYFFINKHNLHSVRIITSAEELPRAMQELTRYLQNKALVIGYPISLKKKDYNNIFIEYNKYLLVILASFFGLQDELNLSYS